ncbi:FecI family ECF sigma factor, partial [Pseudomonas syringae pv. actinidiae ICMP 18801]
MTCSSTPDQTFVGDLYAQHSGWLHQWLMRRFGSSFNTADVADLTHDTFLRLLLKPRAFVMPGEARNAVHLSGAALRLTGYRVF